jgi:acetyl-CoA C-acetyltransferase
MTSAPVLGPAYIIAARRTALGRPGGLHKSRRIESLTSPVVLAALEDAGLEPGAVDEIIFGNTTAGGNPARIIGLAAGLGEGVPALTVDRQCASGLDAILLGARAVALSEARVVVAGGGESLSTAPWRVARPKSLFQTPRFLGLEPEDGAAAPHSVTASETLARRLGIGRERQDAYALQSHLKAERAAGERRFVREIVPLRMAAGEARDESAEVESLQDLAELVPIVPPDGTHTHGNISAPQEGAAIAVIVAQEVWAALGRPHAMRLAGGVTQGVGASEEARAPVAALEKLMRTNSGFSRDKLALVEMSETSAAQALAVRDAFDLADEELSPDGGALVRGYPLGAASAVSLVRLFTRMVRSPEAGQRPYGAVTQGAIGGLGVAALFEAV